MRWSILLWIGLMTGAHADDFAHPAVYRDYPAGRWEDWSWANRDMQNASPVRTGQRSICVDFYPWAVHLVQKPQRFRGGRIHALGVLGDGAAWAIPASTSARR